MEKACKYLQMGIYI